MFPQPPVLKLFPVLNWFLCIFYNWQVYEYPRLVVGIFTTKEIDFVIFFMTRNSTDALLTVANRPVGIAVQVQQSVRYSAQVNIITMSNRCFDMNAHNYNLYSINHYDIRSLIFNYNNQYSGNIFSRGRPMMKTFDEN